MNRPHTTAVVFLTGFGWAWVLLVVGLTLVGCAPKEPPYGVEKRLALPGKQRQVWAVAPAVNLSGERQVDPILQADLLYAQLQTVHGLTVIPVNRVAEVYLSLRIEQVQSPEQAALVCDLLGCDALVLPTVTAYDPYQPPKFGASLQLLVKPGSFARPSGVDPRELARRASPAPDEPPPQGGETMLQAVGMFDAANGSVRDQVLAYAHGRHEPLGPMGTKEYFANIDRYCGFVYHTLISDLLARMPKGR